MTVELEPKGGEESFSMGVPNSTFFTLVNESGIHEIIGKQRSNDPLDINKEKALMMAKITEDWSPPAGWFSGIGAIEGKQMFIDFFNTCEGFTTH